MIHITNISMLYGNKLLFDDVTLTINDTYRYGVVGANGTGKSTFLKLLSGDETPHTGQITISKNKRLACLKQDHFKYENTRIIDVVFQGKSELWQALTEKEEILKEALISEKIGYRLAELEEIIAHHDGYAAESLAQTLLIGLGINEQYHYQQLKVLSGGFKLRVLLAQVLFSCPDILLLDEPTNHLDIVTIAWLENYLRREFKGTLVFISHDRDFINNLATHILDIDYGEITHYVGNYDKFLAQKQSIIQQKLHEQKDIEKEIARLRVFIERFRSNPSRSKQSLAREKMIEKIELPDIKKSSRQKPTFLFAPKKQSGKTVLTVKNISKNFGDRTVLKNIDFTVNRGEKVLIIGPNGIGKSTLLKIITGKLTDYSGSFEWGHEALFSYYAQDHHELLTQELSVYDWLLSATEHETANTVRVTLGNVLFTQDDAHKNILCLSGGEGARLLLARSILEHSNTVILDEPTNHLDLEAREALAEALKNYTGTVLLVTHDRYFAACVATRVLALTGNKIHDFKGSYRDYLGYGEDYLKRAK